MRKGGIRVTTPLILCKCGIIKGWCEIHKYTSPYKRKNYTPSLISKHERRKNDIRSQND